MNGKRKLQTTQFSNGFQPDKKLKRDKKENKGNNYHMTLNNDESEDDEYSNCQQPQESTNKNDKGSRQDSSLFELTKKFVEIIQNEPNQMIDLNEAVKQLNVKKRRLYDITNVLEGIGYIEKVKEHSKIKWVGGADDFQLLQETNDMLDEIKQLEQQEKNIDEWIAQLHYQLKNAFNYSEETLRYAYLTQDDFKNINKQTQNESGETMFIVTAPKGTTVEAPVLKQEDGYQYPYQLSLLSKEGEIDVFLCSAEDEQQEVTETNQSSKQISIPEEEHFDDNCQYSYSL